MKGSLSFTEVNASFLEIKLLTSRTSNMLVEQMSSDWKPEAWSCCLRDDYEQWRQQVHARLWARKCFLGQKQCTIAWYIVHFILNSTHWSHIRIITVVIIVGQLNKTIKDRGITVDFWVIKVHTSIKDSGINKGHTSFREPKLAHQTLNQAYSSGPLNPPFWLYFCYILVTFWLYSDQVLSYYRTVS